MRAISLWQPWASLWLSPRKVHETRHWFTAWRGWTLVHAAKRLISDCGPELDELCIAEFGAMWRRTLPTGALAGVVNITTCTPTNLIQTGDEDRLCGDFSDGRYGWKRDAWRRFREPIPYKGRQSFFNVPHEIVEAAIKEVA